MNFTSKIDGLLRTKKETFASYSKFRGVTSQATYIKGKRQAWNNKDLLNIAKFTDTRLAFIDENDKPIVIFNEHDLDEEE